MTPDHVAALLAERYGPPPDRPAAGDADDELTKARRRHELNAALDNAPPGYRRGAQPRQEAS